MEGDVLQRATPELSGPPRGNGLGPGLGFLMLVALFALFLFYVPLGWAAFGPVPIGGFFRLRCFG